MAKPPSSTLTQEEVILSFDEQETLGTFSEVLSAEVDLVNTCTHPSAPVTFIDLPELKHLSSEFFYNFYTKDERTVDTETNPRRIKIETASEALAFQKQRDRNPRSIILKIVPPPKIPSNGFLNKMAQDSGGDLIRENEKVVFEGAVANTRFSSLILKDNKVDETFYNEITASISFTDAYTKSNNQSQFFQILTEKFFSPLANVTQSPSTIKKALSNAQPRGVAYADTDLRYEEIIESLRDVNFVEFNMTLSNAVVSNVVKGSLEDRGNIYQDELMSVEKDAKRIQGRYVREARGFEILSSDYDLHLAPILTVTADDHPEIDEGAVPLGYFIEKTEIFQDPDDPTNTVTRDLKPIVISRYGPINLFDPAVRYGATYIYKVKILYLVSYEANAVDPEGLTPDETIFAISMIASEGVKTQVAAIERIPPPPPRNLIFNYNFSDNALDIFWEEPHNTQRDVVRYQIFKRKSVNESYVLLGELDFDNSTSRVVPLEVAPENKSYRVRGPRKTFQDPDFKREGSHIYALAAIDARGLTSGYSEQVEVKFDMYKNQLIRNRISDPNAPKSYPNLYLKTDFFVDAIKSSDSSRLRIYFDPEYYDAVRTIPRDGKSGDAGKSKAGYHSPIGPSGKPGSSQSSVNLIGDEYRLQIINLDLQNSQTFNITINDTSGEVVEVPLGQAVIKTIL